MSAAAVGQLERPLEAQEHGDFMKCVVKSQRKEDLEAAQGGFESIQKGFFHRNLKQ